MSKAEGSRKPCSTRFVFLDLSPPGYNNWAVGKSKKAWQKLSTQCITAQPSINGRNLLPVESILGDSFAFDIQPSDVPVRFIGKGNIVKHIQSHPSNFNVPNYKEIVSALKYFKYKIENLAAGKGSHTKWVGPEPNNQMFILPKRDPVSQGVFKSFLNHCGIDKRSYIRDIRPNL